MARASTLKAGCGADCYDTDQFLRVVAGGTVTHASPSTVDGLVHPPWASPNGRTLYMVVDETTPEGLVTGESTGWDHAGAGRGAQCGITLSLEARDINQTRGLCDRSTRAG